MLNLAATEGYIAIAKNIMELQEAILEGARKLGLNTIPESKVNVNVIYSNEYDLMPTVEGLRNDGWILRTTTSFPPIGITVSVRLQSDGQIEAFLNDLRKNMKLAEPIKSKAEMKVYGPEYPMIY